MIAGLINAIEWIGTVLTALLLFVGAMTMLTVSLAFFVELLFEIFYQIVEWISSDD